MASIRQQEVQEVRDNII